VFSSLVALYKAMGGGWVVTAEQMTHKTPQREGSVVRKTGEALAELPR
jgi:multidrug efflux system outer membrane protein